LGSSNPKLLIAFEIYYYFLLEAVAGFKGEKNKHFKCADPAK
jgi:hypothetical protein